MKEKLSFTKINRLIEVLTDIYEYLDMIYSDRNVQEEGIRNLCGRILREDAEKSLVEVSVQELKKSKAGIRVSALTDAGYDDLYKLSCAKDWELLAVQGIGEKQLEAIRNIITEFINRISEYTSLRISDDGTDMDNDRKDLIRAIHIFRQCELIRRDAEGTRVEYRDFIELLSSEPIIRSRLKWLFSGRKAKEHTILMLDEIVSFCDSSVFTRAKMFTSQYSQALEISQETAINDYERNSAYYYAIIEKIGISGTQKPLIYSSISAELAAEIDAYPLNIAGFRGALRAYQEFGAKYILHQERVLLGDEMGLGKTIQAIAAMIHIKAEDAGSHFLIVCPASVLINWCREIRKFSDIDTYLVHGTFAWETFEKWQSLGGAAVTNFETMGKIVDYIDNHMRLSLLIIDEAHYIKNPDAQRTRNIRRLDNESDRILMMSGTPLENRVEEMCSLIDFIRPDMSSEIRSLAQMSSVPQFREMIAPFYLRRTRDQVLKELPEIEEEQEWCLMSTRDKELYIYDITQNDFAGMRRVSFRDENLSGSAKAGRLVELCDLACEEGRRVVVYSFFRETIDRVRSLLGGRCAGVICGTTPITERQAIIDKFSEDEEGRVLICQVQSGGTGLNIQAASVVIFCEPQIKPSLTNQAISRVYRMGQVHNVLVYHLLCEDTLDEAMLIRLGEKQSEFDTYADRSVMAEATDNLLDREWIRQFIDKEREKYLPMVV
ncbi:MAG: DEAD/DEAH box helicase [Lachnospiraceae bacterium]|nr:DEAD/DEAH box helicase [Lachnospiraceae bacterium]